MSAQREEGIAGRTTVAHGYSLASIDRAAWIASNNARSSMLSPTEMREEAWMGIVEILYLTPEKPAFWSLVNAGENAINSRVRAELRHDGYRPMPADAADTRTRRRDPEGGENRMSRYEKSPRFVSYWMPRIGTTSDWTQRIVEAMALPRVLGLLSPEQYQAISTLAAFNNDVGAAAEALGRKYHGYYYVVQTARQKLLAAWFDGETPAGSKKTGETCRTGHRRDQFGRLLPDGRWECKVCQRNAGRRRAAQGPRGGASVVDDAAYDETDEPARLTFAPPPEDGEPVGARVGTVIGSTACWCGLEVGHDWPHKTDGAPHPATA